MAVKQKKERKDHTPCHANGKKIVSKACTRPPKSRKREGWIQR